MHLLSNHLLIKRSLRLPHSLAVCLFMTACGGDNGDTSTPSTHTSRQTHITQPRYASSLADNHSLNPDGSTASTPAAGWVVGTSAPDENVQTASSPLLMTDGRGPFTKGETHIQRKAIAQRVLTPSTKGFLTNSPQYARLYGPGVFHINALANTVIGAYNKQHSMISNRFKAGTSAHLHYVRLLFATGPGYSSGTGGALRITIRPDDGSGNNLPNMNQILASATYRPNLINGGGRRTYFHTIQMNSQQPLRTGQLYHLVVENIDSNTARNFISIDHAVTHHANGRPSRWVSARDWATLFAARPMTVQRPFRWRSLTAEGSSGNFFSPIMEIGYANGHVEGVADMESGSVDPSRVYTALAARPIRERFTPRKNRVISGISVATSAAVGGTLRWRLMHEGQPLATGTISQPRANYVRLKMNSGAIVTNMVWYDINLSRNIQLAAGRHYDLEFRPEGGSQWKFAPHRNGSAFGFKWPAAFTESQAQHQVNGRWVNTHYWNYQYTQGQRGTNWPVVLHIAP